MSICLSGHQAMVDGFGIKKWEFGVLRVGVEGFGFRVYGGAEEDV